MLRNIFWTLENRPCRLVDIDLQVIIENTSEYAVTIHNPSCEMKRTDKPWRLRPYFTCTLAGRQMVDRFAKPHCDANISSGNKQLHLRFC
jgi:hypothetical protein